MRIAIFDSTLTCVNMIEAAEDFLPHIEGKWLDAAEREDLFIGCTVDAAEFEQPAEPEVEPDAPTLGQRIAELEAENELLKGCVMEIAAELFGG